MTHATRRRAFTLVELLVVIGIIGLLVAILLPALKRARDQAMVTQCLSNLHQIGTAQGMYINDNHGHFPNKTVTDFAVGGGTVTSGATQYSWVGKAGMAGYAAATSDLRPFNRYLNLNAAGLDVPVAHCPADIAFNNTVGYTCYDYCGTSYAQNQATESPGYGSTYKHTLVEPVPVGSTWTGDFGLRITYVISPTRMVTMAESGAYYDGWPFATASQFAIRWHTQSNAVNGTVLYNCLFADGHSAAVPIRKSDNGVGTSYSFYYNQ